MRMARLTSIVLIFFISHSVHAQQPILKIAGKDSANLVLQKYKVEVSVVGNTAITSMEMTFCNRTGRVLEGELTFPMPDGVSISRYALDINGKMREAVPVEKEKGQVVFENIERKNIDPGLLEKTEGNNFRTRIYPIPAKGCRTVIIGYEQELKMTGKAALSYDLPLHFKQPINDFSISFKIFSTAAPEIGSDCSTDMKFSEMKNVYETSVKKRDFKPDGNFSITVPKFSDASEVLMQNINGQYYFLVNSYPEVKKIDKNIPDNISIIWDASLSGLNRNHEKEFELLDNYFKKKSSCTVNLCTIAYSMKSLGTFRVSGGNWNDLKQQLQKMVYDGGTDFSLIKNLPAAGEHLFFTDGLNTYSNSESISQSGIPVITINASANADYPLVKFIAASTGGVFINLNEQTVDMATEQLTGQQLQLIGVKSNSTVSDIYPSLTTPITGSCTLTGISSAGNATIILQYGYGKTVAFEKTIELNANQQQTNNINLQKIWAQKKINQLETQYETFKDMITDIGKKYGLVTRNTSLIVLDAIEDYVKYEIEPPLELKGEYSRLIKIKDQKERVNDLRSVNEAAKYYGALNGWWNKHFPAKRVKYKTEDDARAEGQITYTNGSGNHEAVMVPMYDSMGTVLPVTSQGYFAASPGVGTVNNLTSNFTVSTTSQVAFNMRTTRRVARPRSQQSGLVGASDRIVLLDADGRADESNKEFASSLGIYNWSSADSSRTATMPGDAAVAIYDSLGVISTIEPVVNEKSYLKQLDSASTGNLYEKYLSMRNDYLDDPVFFFDVAKRLFASGDTATGLKVLSNIADLNFNDHELYKMLGYQLKVMQQYEKEVFVYKKVLQWRPHEPQSYRDYALALADAGRCQQALDTLYFSLTKNFDEEIASLYPGIEEVITTDMNNLISQHGSEVNLSKIDKRIIKNLPVDVRVVLNWNMNATDIDLWVFDPNNEKCFYSHKLTTIGGRISNDFTRGYGPEQFMLKKALTGKYKVMLHYYGDTQQKIAGATTVMAEIFTNYGKPNQRSKTIALQMEAGRSEVLVGEFEF